MRPYFEKMTERLRVQRTDAKTFPEHLHTQAELLYITQGTAQFLIDGKVYPMHPGDFCIAFPGAVHAYLPPDHAYGLMMIFSPEIIPDFTSTLTRYQTDCPFIPADQLPADVPICLNQMLLESSNNDIIMRGYLQVVLARVLPLLQLKGRGSEVSDIVYRILEYLSQHFAEPVSLDSLARSLGVSRSYLSHTFSQRLGTNFRTYINTLRCDHARSLLLDTHLSITEIAYDCGFETQRTFNRVFVELYGQTPSDLRKTHA